MSRGKQLVVDRPAAEPQAPARAVEPCAAHGCPLPGTVGGESGQRMCSGHSGADPDGWPKATAVMRNHEALWRYARDAQCTAAPLCTSTESAKLLFEAAIAAGLTFNDAQREQYRRAPMKLKMAGTLVESAICAEASAAAMTRKAAGDMRHEEDGEKLTQALRALIQNIGAKR